MGGTTITIDGTYFYSDENLPASIQVGGKECQLLSFEKLTSPNTRLTCQAPTPDQNSHEFSGNRGITLIKDNTYIPFEKLQNATPSALAVVSQLASTSYQSSTRNVTIWMKGYLVPGKTSEYRFELVTNGNAVLFISNDTTSANKVGYFYFKCWFE